jgi:hypothetical protein
MASNRSAPLSSLPLHCLDRDPIGIPRGRCRFPPTRFGVFPIPVYAAAREEREWRREGGSCASHHCWRAAAGGRPWRGGAGPGATRGEDAHTETRWDRELSEEPGAAVNTYTMPPSSSSRRRLHLRLAVRTSFPPFSCAARTLDSTLVGVLSSRRAPCVPRRHSPMGVHRVTPHRCEPSTVATPGRDAGCS